MNAVLKIFALGMRRATEKDKSSLLLALLFMTSSVTVCGLCATTSIWREASEAHLNSSGFNRLTISSASEKPINVADIETVESTFQGVATKVVPQITTMIQIKKSNGDFGAFLASSAVEDDPLLASSPLQSGSDMTGGNQMIVSPETMRRLGFYDLESRPSFLDIRIPRPGTAIGEDAEIQCEVAGVVGALGDLGVRLPLDLLVSIRLYQCGLDPKLPLLEGIASLEEINAVHIVLPSEVDMDVAAATLKSSGYQVSSPYFEHGQGRTLMSIAMRVAVPVAAFFIAVNALLILLIGVQQVRNDRERLLWLKLSGAGTWTMFSWYVLPKLLVCCAATVLGIAGSAVVLFAGMDELSHALNLNGDVAIPIVSIFIGVMVWGLLTIATPIYFQTRQCRNAEIF